MQPAQARPTTARHGWRRHLPHLPPPPPEPVEATCWLPCRQKRCRWARNSYPWCRGACPSSGGAWRRMASTSRWGAGSLLGGSPICVVVAGALCGTAVMTQQRRRTPRPCSTLTLAHAARAGARQRRLLCAPPVGARPGVCPSLPGQTPEQAHHQQAAAQPALLRLPGMPHARGLKCAGSHVGQQALALLHGWAHSGRVGHVVCVGGGRHTGLMAGAHARRQPYRAQAAGQAAGVCGAAGGLMVCPCL